LAPPTRDALLRELFPAGIGGIGMSCLRISIGASDLSSATLRKSAPAAALLVAPGAHRRGCARRRVQQGPRSHMADIMTRDVIIASPDSNQLNLMYVNSVRGKQQQWNS